MRSPGRPFGFRRGPDARVRPAAAKNPPKWRFPQHRRTMLVVWHLLRRFKQYTYIKFVEKRTHQYLRYVYPVRFGIRNTYVSYTVVPRRQLHHRHVCVRPTEVNSHKFRLKSELTHRRDVCSESTTLEYRKMSCTPAPYTFPGGSYTLPEVLWIFMVYICFLRESHLMSLIISRAVEWNFNGRIFFFHFYFIYYAKRNVCR
jgi:hypothetical protein